MTVSPKQITPVILCGGSGTRLWPRSRAHKPKPFLPLVQEETLFQQALWRCGDPVHFGPPIVVTGSQHVEHEPAQDGEDILAVVSALAKLRARIDHEAEIARRSVQARATEPSA